MSRSNSPAKAGDGQANLVSTQVPTEVARLVNRRRYAVIEVKRGQASPRAIDQVVAYAEDLRTRYGAIDAWVAAHVITDAVRIRAKGMGVKVLEVKPSAVAHLLAPRTSRRAMRQGSPVPNSVALAELPGAVAAVLQAAAARPGFTLESWTNRTYLQFRGEDLLGLLRQGSQRHIFVKPSGSSRPETHADLIAAGFTAKAKRGKYDHPWYHARIDDAAALRRAIPVLQADVQRRKSASICCLTASAERRKGSIPASRHSKMRAIWPNLRPDARASGSVTTVSMRY